MPSSGNKLNAFSKKLKTEELLEFHTQVPIGYTRIVYAFVQLTQT